MAERMILAHGFSYRQYSQITPHSVVVTVGPDEDAGYLAVCALWDCYYDADPPTAEEWLVAKTHGEAPIDRSDDEDESLLYVLWYAQEKQNVGIGFGPSSDGTGRGTDREENVWIEWGEWTPDPERAAELRKLTHEELVSLVLREEARE